MDSLRSNPGTNGATSSREELAERVLRIVREDGDVEMSGGLRLLRRSAPTPKDHGISSPSLCVIAQGEKEVLLGDDIYHYDKDHYLISTAALPTTSRVTGASEDHPYLGVVLELDPALVGSVIVEVGRPASEGRNSLRAFDVSPLDSNLLDAVLRLVRLTDARAEEVRFLRPLIMREIVFRLLEGNQQGRLHQIAALGGYAHRITGVINVLRRDFSRPLKVEELARESGMSVSGFHHHFKMITAMSPVQFQKRMRLQEARRLMIGEDLDAGSAGRHVGYGDPSHFSRDYKRLFGTPPSRDTTRLKGEDKEGAPL